MTSDEPVNSLKRAIWLLAVAATVVIPFVGCQRRAVIQPTAPGAEVRGGAWRVSPLTEVTGGIAVNPVWSPRGDSIAFDWLPFGARPAQLRMLTPGPGKIATLAADGSQATWSPDAERLVYVSRERLWLRDMAAGRSSLLTRHPDANGSSDQAPGWSPNGKWIAFYHLAGGDDNWTCVVSAEDSGVRRLGAADLALQVPQWSPDSQEFCYLRMIEEGSVTLWRASLATGRASPLIDASNLERLCPAQRSPLDDDVAYVCQRREGVREVRLVNAGTGADRLLLTVRAKVMQDLAWSPNGKLLAFIAGSDRTGYEIRVFELKTKRVTRVTSSLSAKASRPCGVAWAPDSSRLAFCYNGNLWLAVCAEGS